MGKKMLMWLTVIIKKLVVCNIVSTCAAMWHEFKIKLEREKIIIHST